MESIFSSLWKRKDIPEDFRTEILCWVLRNLDSQSLLNDFFKSLGISINKLEQPSIFTQHTSGVNRFDIIIKATARLFLKINGILLLIYGNYRLMIITFKKLQENIKHLYILPRITLLTMHRTNLIFLNCTGAIFIKLCLTFQMMKLQKNF